MRKKAYNVFFTAFLTGLMVIFSTTAFARTVRVGILLHLTGDLSQFGQMQKKSLLIALEDLKDREGDLTNVELVFQDASTSPEQARTALEDLISKREINMLISGTSSISAWEAASLAESHKIPLLIFTASEDKITKQGWEYVFRLNPPFSEYGNGLLWFLSEVVRPRTISMIRSQGFAGMLSSEDLIDYCKKAGYEIVSDHLYTQDTHDFRPMLRQIKDKKPDVIAMASYLHDAVDIMQQCKELKLRPLLFVGLGGGFTLPQFGELAGNSSDYVYSISLWDNSVPYAGSKAYYNKYLNRYHTRPDYHGAEAYAAMQVVMNALSRVQNVDRVALRNSIASSETMTIMGPVKFVSYGNKTQQNRLPTYLVQWLDGEMKTVWPPGLAHKRYVFPFPGWNAK